MRAFDAEIEESVRASLAEGGLLLRLAERQRAGLATDAERREYAERVGPFIRSVMAEPADDPVTAALDSLSERYGRDAVRRAANRYLRRDAEGRPSKEGPDPREQRLLLLVDILGNNLADFARLFWRAMGSNSARAAERQLRRLQKLRPKP